MRKPIVDEWLKAAASDLAVIESISGRIDLTHMVAFHAQQCVEKVLKAAAEQYDLKVPKTHSLDRLVQILADGADLSMMPVSQDMLDLLDDLYIDARYPGEMGLLPAGIPTIEEAAEVYRFALTLHQFLSSRLGG